jgi:crotonobetainyl-CoA:carnitine CoA-transferase CaiB-like acyl-CoA transferase
MGVEGIPPARLGWRLTGRYACYRVYRCADGRWLSVAALEPRFWQQLCSALGRPDLEPRQYEEGEAQLQLQRELEAVFAGRGRDEWVAALDGLDVCCEPVLELDEVPDHPQVAARGLVLETPAGGLETAPAVPGDPGWRRREAPRLGEHTAELLEEVGVGAEELEALRSERVV